MKAIYQDDSSELIEKNTKKVSNIGFCLIIGIICGILGYGLSLLTNSTFQKPITTKKAILAKKSVVQSKKPTFFNYYDSILFLNQVHGKKKVVSKGFDDYIKKNKLIVKAGDYYYNLYCDDLIDNYTVGDSIP